MKKFFLLLIFCCLGYFSNQSLASHYLGSDISYTCLGGNQYEIKVRYYSDCNGGGMGTSMVLAANSSCATNQNIFLSLTTTQPLDITPVCPTAQTSCNGGSGVYGIEMYEYTGTATLAACSDWLIDYNSCCRSNSGVNLNFPTSQGHYIYTLLDNVNQPCNSSPQLNPVSDMIACVGDTLYTSTNAIDPDGDSLVYSLTDCFTNSTTTNTTYSAGFSGTTPFTGSTSIDAATGLITLAPTALQSGYICIMIEEYRNGAKINETVRDYLIQVQNCTNTLPKVHQINGGNIAMNSQITTSVGATLSLDFYIYDPEVIAGTQTLLAAPQSNFTSSFNYNAATSTLNVTWTPTTTDVGTQFLHIFFEDDNCPFIGGGDYLVEIEVLNTPFVTAVDDAFFGLNSVPLTGNLLANDVSSSGNLVILTTPITTPPNGTMTINPNGDCTYLNNAGFTGIDSFSYSVCDNNGLCDTANVYLNLTQSTMTAVNDSITFYEDDGITINVLNNDVSNGSMVVTSIYTPTSGANYSLDSNGTLIIYPDVYNFAPFSIYYEVCNGNHCDNAFIIANALPTNYFTDTLSLGANYLNYDCVTGSNAAIIGDTLNNAILTFNNGSCFSLYANQLGTDTIQIGASAEKRVYRLTVENGVWPGDTDDDALVNNVDLLNIGLAYNTVGVPRNAQSLLWNGYLANDWGTTFAGTSLDYKHADTDGNGTVDANDTMAIIQNWGLSYNKNGGGTGAPIYLETDSMTIVNDSVAYIPIMLGTVQTPVTSIYGIAFTIDYNWQLVKSNSVMVHFDPSWLGLNNTNMISIDKDFYDDELTEVAVTRIDGMNIGGSGQIGRMCFTIQDDIIRGVDSLFGFNISNIVAIDNGNNIVPIQGLNRDIHWQTIIDIHTNTQTVDLSDNIAIYPNPATDYLNIQTNNIQIETIEIYNSIGQKVLEKQNENNINRLDISDLQKGIYIVQITTNLGVVTKRVLIE